MSFKQYLDLIVMRLRYGTPTHSQISSDAITITDSYHSLEPQTGTSDTLSTINARDASQQRLLLRNRDSGDTITIDTAGNITLMGATSVVLANQYEHVELVYSVDLAKWCMIGGPPTPHTHGASSTGGALYSVVNYVFQPDEAPGVDIAAGDQEGIIHHSGPVAETAVELLVDFETAPGTNTVITIQEGNTNDLDTVASWATIATLTATGKSSSTTSMSQATITASRLLRMNVTSVSGTAPKDGTITLRVKRPLTT